MKQTPRTLLKRGEFPPEAYIGAAELRRIYAAARFGTDKRHAKPLPFIAISHFWRTAQHPDPDGETLGLIAEALRARWEEFTRRSVTDLGIFFDYCSLPRKRRTPRSVGSSCVYVYAGAP